MLRYENTKKQFLSAKKELLYQDLEPIDVFMSFNDLINDRGGDFQPLSMWVDIQYDDGHSTGTIVKYLAYILYGSVDRLTIDRAALYVTHQPVAGYDPNDFLIKTTRLNGCRIATRRDLIKVLNDYIKD